MKTKIREAISNKKALRFLYDASTRIVEPYCFGESAVGADVLQAYQIRGYSMSSSLPKGWRLFIVSEITNLTILENETFDGKRRDYSPDDATMVRIHCRLPKSR
jgi:predicted DNA-binding transcriptional regulator YafY